MCTGDVGTITDSSDVAEVMDCSLNHDTTISRLSLTMLLVSCAHDTTV